MRSSVVWRADAPPSGEAAIVEVGWGEPSSAAHIPGAIYLDTNALEREHDAWRLAPDDELIHLFEMTGLSIGTTVFLYASSPLPAARAAIALMYAGVEDVRVLDGGFRAYLASGRPVAVGTRRAPSPRAFGAKRPRNPSLIIRRDEVAGMIGDPDAVIADVRSLAEFEGRTSGYPYIEDRGRIPGACWAKGGPHRNRVEEYTDDGGGLHAVERVVAMWREQGIDRSKRIAFYCGTSWRASIALLFARAASFPRAALYDGGWMEWSSSSSSSGARRVPTTCDKREP